MSALIYRSKFYLLQYFLLVTISILHPGFLQASDKYFKKSDNETDKQFIERSTGEKVIERQIGLHNNLIKSRQVLVAFTESRSANKSLDEYDINLNIFIPMVGVKYSKLSVTACDIQGGPPTLRSFFYAKADTSSNLSIGVICGWDSAHVAADCQLNNQVSFYKIPTNLDKGEIEEIKDKKFAAFYSEGPSQYDPKFKCTISNFGTAADVKKILSKLGFQQ